MFVLLKLYVGYFPFGGSIVKYRVVFLLRLVVFPPPPLGTFHLFHFSEAIFVTVGWGLTSGKAHSDNPALCASGGGSIQRLEISNGKAGWAAPTVNAHLAELRMKWGKQLYIARSKKVRKKKIYIYLTIFICAKRESMLS